MAALAAHLERFLQNYGHSQDRVVTPDFSRRAVLAVMTRDLRRRRSRQFAEHTGDDPQTARREEWGWVQKLKGHESVNRQTQRWRWRRGRRRRRVTTGVEETGGIAARGLRNMRLESRGTATEFNIDTHTRVCSHARTRAAARPS